MYPVDNYTKELFHKDTRKKNIRIHFPNGERSDICNNLIVKDSVSFKESLCSQESLKFGLCEASVFECETVGVGNITGARIEVSCEIYSDIGGIWRTDLQAKVAVIPYGTFIVDSAKRQADLNHRKIVAYGLTSQLNSGLGCVEKAKFKDYASSSSSKYTFKTFPWVFGNLNMKHYSTDVFDREYITSRNYSKTGTSQAWVISPNVAYYYRIVYSTNALIFGSGYTAVSELNSLYYINAEDNGLDNAYERVCDFLKQYSCPDGDLPFKFDFQFSIDWSYTGGYAYFYQKDIPDQKLPLIFFAKIPNADGCYMVIPHSVTVELRDYSNDDVIDTLTINNFTRYTSFVKLTEKSGDFDDYTTTIEVYEDDNLYHLQQPSNFNNINLLNALIELTGNFGHIDRSELFNIINIRQQFGLLPATTLYPDTDLYPQGVTGGKLLPEDYQSCWYDDDYTLPYGRIRCQYKNTSNVDKVMNYHFNGFDKDSDVNTYKVYDISSNIIIQGSKWTKTQIREICRVMALNLVGVTYMPVEFVGRGLPYVEAGDTFEILTKSNDSITTIVLNRTITGELTLTDSYKSV